MSKTIRNTSQLSAKSQHQNYSPLSFWIEDNKNCFNPVSVTNFILPESRLFGEQEEEEAWRRMAKSSLKRGIGWLTMLQSFSLRG